MEDRITKAAFCAATLIVAFGAFIIGGIDGYKDGLKDGAVRHRDGRLVVTDLPDGTVVVTRPTNERNHP